MIDAPITDAAEIYSTNHKCSGDTNELFFPADADDELTDIREDWHFCPTCISLLSYPWPLRSQWRPFFGFLQKPNSVLSLSAPLSAARAEVPALVERLTGPYVGALRCAPLPRAGEIGLGPAPIICRVALSAAEQILFGAPRIFGTRVFVRHRLLQRTCLYARPSAAETGALDRAQPCNRRRDLNTASEPKFDPNASATGARKQFLGLGATVRTPSA